MSGLVELVTAFPAVVFTALLAFCTAWWLVATLAGLGDGLDADPDGDGALDDLGDALGISSVPPAIALTIVSFVGWVVSLVVTAGLRTADLGGAAIAAAGLAGVALALVAGVLVARPLARRVAPLFSTEPAPSEREALGAYARVRSPEVDDDLAGPPGEVVVTSGPLRGATFRAQAGPGRRYQNGAAVHIVDVDDVGGRLVVTVDDIPHELAP
jgi:hypothetical protein